MSRIDYDLTLIRAIAFDIDGVLSPVTIPLGPDGTPVRMANLRDGYAIQLAVKLGLKIAIITGADSDLARIRYSALGVTDIFTKVAHKGPVFRKWMADNGLDAASTAYVGDDIPDLPPMCEAGLAVCPADACPDILAQSRYISPCAGGQGVARDLIEQVLRAKGLWLADERAFGW